MPSVLEFLTDINLEQLNSQFCEEGYEDFESLKLLAEAEDIFIELDEMGITKKGHQLKIKKALSKMAATTSPDLVSVKLSSPLPVASASAPAPAPLQQAMNRDEAEDGSLLFEFKGDFQVQGCCRDRGMNFPPYIVVAKRLKGYLSEEEYLEFTMDMSNWHLGLFGSKEFCWLNSLTLGVLGIFGPVCEECHIWSCIN